MAESTNANNLTAAGIRWQRYGPAHAPKLLILHGLFGSGDNWRSHAKALATSWDVWVADMPNHGRSDRLEDPSYRQVSARLWAALDELGLANVAIIGHSMGGKAAMMMALDRPERVDALVVVDIAPVRYPAWHHREIAALKAVVTAAPQGRKTADAVLAEYVDNVSVRMFLLKSWAPRGDGSYQLQLAIDVIEAHYDVISGWPQPDLRYDGPMLVVRGGASEYVLAEHDASFARHFSRRQTATIAGAGHWLHAERRDEFLTLVARFLPSVGGSVRG